MNKKSSSKKKSLFTPNKDERFDEQLFVLADIRSAVGDPTGKLMQDELVQRVKDIVFALGTAIVLTERNMFAGPKLIKEWKALIPKEKV